MIVVVYHSLPSRVPAIVHLNSDDSYTIIVNNNLSEESQKEAIQHEITHILGGDLYKEDDVGNLESSCHNREHNFQFYENMEIYVKDGE